MIGPGSDKKEDRLWLYFCTSNITLCWSVKWLQCLYKDWVYWESICDALKLCLALITSALQARKSYRMSLNPSHVTSCCQLWQQLQAVYSFDSSRMLWQLLQAFPSFDTCYKLLTALTAVTSCWQLITTSTLLKYLIPSLRVNLLSPALTAVTSCWQLHPNFITTSTLLKYLIPSIRVNSLSPVLTAVTTVASFASFARCYKLLAAKPQFHFNVNIAEIFDSIIKSQFIVASFDSCYSCCQLCQMLQAGGS